MTTNRKTAAQRQYDNFLSAVREFDCNSTEGQFERTLARLIAAHWEMRRTNVQPSRSECEHEARQRSLGLDNTGEHRRGDVPDLRPRPSLD